jgi:hypothetical protein
VSESRHLSWCNAASHWHESFDWRTQLLKNFACSWCDCVTSRIYNQAAKDPIRNREGEVNKREARTNCDKLCKIMHGLNSSKFMDGLNSLLDHHFSDWQGVMGEWK